MAVANVVHLVQRRQTILAHLALRRYLHHALYALDNIVNMGKIALAVAIVENLNRLANQQLVCKAKFRHIRTTCRTINREEAQAGRQNIVQLAIGMRQSSLDFLVAA